METKVYKIEGIKNLIEWDGVNPPRLRRIKKKGYVKIQRDSMFGTLNYNVRTDSGRRTRVTLGRLTLMLRTGATPEMLKNVSQHLDRDGRPYSESADQRNRSDRFKSLEELEETVAIIRHLQGGNPLPLYRALEQAKPRLRKMAWPCKVSCQLFDLLYDETVLAVERRLREMQIRSLKKGGELFYERAAEGFSPERGTAEGATINGRL